MKCSEKWSEPTAEGKLLIKTLRLLCVLGVSAVSSFWGRIPPPRRRVRRGFAEKSIFPTDYGPGSAARVNSHHITSSTNQTWQSKRHHRAKDQSQNPGAQPCAAAC